MSEFFESSHNDSIESAKSTPEIENCVPRQTTGGVTFRVDDVDPLGGELWLTNLGDSLTGRTGDEIILMPESARPALAFEGYGREQIRPKTAPGKTEYGPLEPRRNAVARLADPLRSQLMAAQQKRREFLHPLIQTIDLAFAQHRPLVLSPDSVWMVIIQGFGHHVHLNSEALRNRIVRHDGKKTLEVSSDSLQESAWLGLIAQLAEKIREASDPVLHETLLCESSTTTPHISTALRVALMDVYQDYFEYQLNFVCGIPRITLEGTVEDWQRMRERLEVLATYDLAWWTEKVAPIFDQFVATAKGSPNQEFWKAIYKPERPYAAVAATGWIADLFPYLHNSQLGWFRNSVLGLARTEWRLPVSEHSMFSKGVNIKNFPSGLSRAQVKINSVLGSCPPQTELDLVGGFLGMGQRDEDHSLYPILSWALVKRGAKAIPAS